MMPEFSTNYGWSTAGPTESRASVLIPAGWRDTWLVRADARGRENTLFIESN
jgi:hypothetical protein